MLRNGLKKAALLTAFVLFYGAQLPRVQAQSLGLGPKAIALASWYTFVTVGFSFAAGVVYHAVANKKSEGIFLWAPDTLLTLSKPLDQGQVRAGVAQALAHKGFKWVFSNRKAVVEDLFKDDRNNIVQVKYKYGKKPKIRIRVVAGRSHSSTLVADDIAELSAYALAGLTRRQRKIVRRQYERVRAQKSGALVRAYLSSAAQAITDLEQN